MKFKARLIRIASEAHAFQILRSLVKKKMKYKDSVMRSHLDECIRKIKVGSYIHYSKRKIKKVRVNKDRSKTEFDFLVTIPMILTEAFVKKLTPASGFYEKDLS